MQCQLTLTEQATGVLVRIDGRLDAYCAPTAEDTLLRLANDTAGTVTIDCSAISYVSSAGMRVLLVAAKAMKARHRTLRLQGVYPELAHMLSLAGMAAFFDLSAA